MVDGLESLTRAKNSDSDSDEPISNEFTLKKTLKMLCVLRVL